MQTQAPNLEKAEQKVTHKTGVHRLGGSEVRFQVRRRGFSLIEILVVISLIALLIGIGTAVGVKMSVEARKEQTRAMMEALLSANDEFKAVRQGSSISHIGPVSGLSSTEQFVNACLQIKTCEEIMMAALSSSSSQSLERTYKNGGGNGLKSVYDRWGTEIEYRQFNSPSSSTPAPPANETGGTVANNQLPASRDPFFASAGPDKQWGTDDDITTLEP